jgi:two-component system LytT family response regulator
MPHSISRTSRASAAGGHTAAKPDANSLHLVHDTLPSDAGLRVLIVDDESLARRKLRLFLSEVEGVSEVAECASGMEALAFIRREHPDLLFLDVRMPGIDGFDVLRQIRGDHVPDVVFVTAHDKYAVQAFEVEALDFLLKPFDRERFGIALDRAWRRIAAATAKSGMGVREIAAGQGDPRRIVVRSGGRILPLLVEKIEWIESADNYVRLHTAQQTYEVRETLASLQRRLDPRQFLRIHRCALVNVDALIDILPLLHGEYEARLKSGQSLRVGRTRRVALRRFFGL